MSKKSVVLLAGLGLAATAAGAWVVRMRSTVSANQTDAIEHGDRPGSARRRAVGDRVDRRQ